MSRSRECRQLHQRLAAQLNDQELLDHENAWHKWMYSTSRPIGEKETDQHIFARMIWFVYHAERMERNDQFNCPHPRDN